MMEKIRETHARLGICQENRYNDNKRCIIRLVREIDI